MARKGRRITFCWCRCICHTPGMEIPGGHGDIICAHTTRNGRCAECIRICNQPRPQDRP
jgi:hypothetical protein